MVINGASVMPDKANPNFKIYTVDSTGYVSIPIKKKLDMIQHDPARLGTIRHDHANNLCILYTYIILMNFNCFKDIMDAEVYSFDLEKANNDKIETIKWEKLYSFANEFGVSKLVPSELDALIKRMADGIKKKDYTLIDLYHK